MAYHYKSAGKFYDAIKALCKPDAYNLVLHKHLGDVFYAVGTMEEFEATYNAKLRFIVRPQHEFIMQMWEIKDYSVYDFDSLVKNNKEFKDDHFDGETPDARRLDLLENAMFQAVFHCLPIRGEPFVCENLVNDFFLYPRFWAYRWAANMGVKVEDNFHFGIPKHAPTLPVAAQKSLVNIAPLDKIVLFAPEATTATEFPAEFWDVIAERVHEHGYKIIVNGEKHQIKHGISAFDLDLSLSDVVALGFSCAYVFSLRSGLCDVLVGAREKLYAFYPAMLHREMNSLNKCFEPNPNVHEIAVWRWKIDKVIWEGEDLTQPLQRYVNKLHRGYLMEQVKSFVALPFRRKRSKHRSAYREYRDLAGKSRCFPENNTENRSHKYPDQKISFLGLPVYTREYKAERQGHHTIRHQLLGGLVQLKKHDKKDYRLYILGISVFSHDKWKQKILGINVCKYDHTGRWLDDTQARIDRKYDDIYIFRHNIGESYVELMHLGDAIKANQSVRPLLVLWDKKYAGFYKMFLPQGMELQFVRLHQDDIHAIFDQETLISHNGQRFICTTPLIAQNMKKLMAKEPGVNFYDYINNAAGVEKNATPARPKPSTEAVRCVKSKIKRIELSDKFVILCPETNSLVELKSDFWETLAEGLHKKGYDIFVNAYDKDFMLKNAKNARMTIEEMFILARQSKGVITLGSGLSVFLTAADVKMDLLYTDFNTKGIGYDSELAIRIYSVHHLPHVSGELVKEYDTSKWNGQNLVDAILQRY